VHANAGDGGDRSECNGDFTATRYATANERCFHNYTFFWQAVALSVAAEAFLFTIALGHTTSDAGPYIAASLTAFVATASLVLMRSQRKYQTIEGVWLVVIEERQEPMSLRGQRDLTRGVGYSYSAAPFAYGCT